MIGPEAGASTYSSAMEAATNYNAWLIDAFARYFGQAVLEIGIGHGGFYELMPALNYYVGLDLDADLVHRARERYPDLQFVQGDLADPALPRQFTGVAIDTVFCANVLEHVPDHQTAVRNMVEIVQPGGHVLLFVPAFRWLYNDLDRLAGHQRRYAMKDLVRLVPPNAKIRRLEYFNPAAVLPWWLNGRVTHRSLETPLVNSQVAFFDRYVLPISRAVTPLTRKWFGQSILCVLRRT